MMNLGEVCGTTGHLAKLAAYARYLAALNQDLQAWLPPPLAGHVELANLRGKELILQAGSPAWASRARFLAPQILDFCRRHPRLAGRVESVRIKVAQPPEPLPPARPKPVLSAPAAESIRAIAEGISDEALRAALQRLAERGRRALP